MTTSYDVGDMSMREICDELNKYLAKDGEYWVPGENCDLFGTADGRLLMSSKYGYTVIDGKITLDPSVGRAYQAAFARE